MSVPPFIEAICAAKEFAEKAHAGQTRNGNKRPYIVHPVGVANLLIQHGVMDIATLQAALLHDVLEDTETSYDELQRCFGQDVAEVVQEVTDDPRLSKLNQKRAQIDRAPLLSPKAALVKLADKIYNIRDLREYPPGWKWASRDGYLEGCRRVLLALEQNPSMPGHHQSLRGVASSEYSKTRKALDQERGSDE